MIISNIYTGITSMSNPSFAIYVIILKKLQMNTTKKAKLLNFFRLNTDVNMLKVKKIIINTIFKVVSQKLF